MRSILARKLKERSKTVDVAGMRKHLAKVDAQLVTARRNMALAGGDDLRREYEAVVRELRSERDGLDASIEPTQQPRGRTQADLDERIDKAIQVLTLLRQSLTAAPVVTQRELLQLCIEKVEVWSSRSGGKGTTFHLEHGIVHLRPYMWLTEAEADNLYSTTRSTA
jgi:hypothetical protein